LNVYWAGRLGIFASADVDWIAGDASVLLGGVTAMLVAGPVLRWSPK